MIAGLRNRNELPPSTAQAFDDLYAELVQFLAQEHHDDGSLFPENADTRGNRTLVPVGAILLWPVTVLPDGWLQCNGQLVNRSTYGTLFRVIGITFGAGNGSTTFQLPTIADLGTAHYLIATGVVSDR